MLRKLFALCCLLLPLAGRAQINTDRVLLVGRNAQYYEDYVLSIQYFNQVADAKPWMYEPYFYRAVSKYYLDDFQGGEADCTLALERNPFVSEAYQVRGLCRINQGKFAAAADDYRQVVHYEPESQGMWQNLVLCLMEDKKFDEAAAEIDTLLARWPKKGKAYVIKAQIALEQKDTASAVTLLHKATEIDPKDGDSWNMLAMLSLQKEKYEEGENYLNKAIELLPKIAGNYINRALARYYQNNLRGAMSDYDTAIDIDPDNYLGHLNRGLLRAQVGDDNRGIEDFNFVLKQEPDNMIVLFNRALLLDNTGDYRGAIRDITRVIKEYPNFWTGYTYRAQIRRKIGDKRGAELDEFKVLKAQVEQRFGGKRPKIKTRKKSDRNMDDYNKLVVADKQENVHHYSSDYRGRVQDKTVEATPQPIYVLSYYEKTSGVKRFIAFHKTVDDLNNRQLLPARLLLTNDEMPLDSSKAQHHFASIAKLTQQIDGQPMASRYFARAMDFYIVQDFENAAADFTHVIDIDANFALAYFMRAVAHFKQMSVQPQTNEVGKSKNESFAPNYGTANLNYADVLADLQKTTTLVPDFVFAPYNMGNVQMQAKAYGKAIEAYTRAISVDSHLAEAYYNRGLAYIFQGDTAKGVADLSKAGELGIYTAYSLIKQYTNKPDSTKK